MEVGTLVRHLKKPEWGPGKILKNDDDSVFIIFRDDAEQRVRKFRVDSEHLVVAEVQSDPRLENLPEFEETSSGLALPHRTMSPQQAVELFLDHFPGGFDDPDYLGSERGYKIEAHDKFQDELGGGSGRELLEKGEIEELVRRARGVVGRVNLLHSTEAAALGDGLKDKGAATPFFGRLFDFIEAESPEESRFERYVSALADLPEPGSRITSWPIATVLPALANPTRFFFLKPEITKEAAKRLRFDLKYSPDPNWKTYSAALTLAETYAGELKRHGLEARDFIDIQSFFWLVSEQFEEWVTQDQS